MTQAVVVGTVHSLAAVRACSDHAVWKVASSVANGGLCPQRECGDASPLIDAMMSNRFQQTISNQHPSMSLANPRPPAFSTFMGFFPEDLYHIYRTMLLLYPSSLFGHALGSWLEHVNHPNDTLSFLFVF
jgi:hypothetical protein